MATGSAHLTDDKGGEGKASIGHLLVWVLAVAIATALLVFLRDVLDKAHESLIYLMIVLLGTARLGRRAGITLALLCFVCLNFFLLPPYHTLYVANSQDWLVLAAFMAASLIAAQLLHRAGIETAIARQHSSDINRLATLGAETLSVGRAEEATEAIARVIQSTLGIGACEVYHAGSDPSGFRLVGRAVRAGYDATADTRTDSMFDYAISHDAVVVQRVEGGIHVLARESGSSGDAGLRQSDARVIAMPLRVRDRAVGILRLSDAHAIRPDASQRRFAEALAYYAALGVERVRLTAEAERAEALHAADQLKDALVAAVSHDLRTPLTTIKALAYELRATGDERAFAIEVEADRLNRLVADLLDLSRLRAGGLQPALELNAIDDLIGAALARLSGLPGASDIEVLLPEGAIVVGRFDLVHSLRALVNLVENALKYSPDGSPVSIRVTQDDDLVMVSVLDRGPGIKPEDTDRVFEPFVRGRNADSTASGAGLGLAIAKALAVAQGGTIEYAARPGGGSEFSLSLPKVMLPENAGKS